MLRTLRTFVVWSGVVCYGITTMLGHGLHELFDADGDDCCDAQLACSSGPCAATTADVAALRPSDGHTGHDEANCPICQFQAQAHGQMAALPVSFAWAFFRGTYLIDDTHLAIVSRAPKPYSSRAPPLV
jgi:hypothetical protein